MIHNADSPLTRSGRSSGRYLRVIVMTLVLCISISSVITYVMPKKYESTAVVQILPSLGTGASHHDGSFLTNDDSFLSSHLALMVANSTMKTVVQHLGLAKSWRMSEDDAIATLRSSVEVRQIRDSDLVAIIVKHTNPIQARDIAQEIYTTYQSIREASEWKIYHAIMSESGKKIEEQYAVMEDLREQHLSDAHKQQMLSAPPLPEKEFEDQQQIIDRLIEKRASDSLNLQPKHLVIIHEEPIVPSLPCSPDVSLNLSLAAAVGLLLGVLLAFVLLPGSNHTA